MRDDWIGDVVTEVVRGFAAREALPEGCVDCWYHGAPIWYVRSHEGVITGTPAPPVRVNRVQITVLPWPEGMEIVLCPDAYAYLPETGELLAVGPIAVKRSAWEHLRGRVCERAGLALELMDALDRGWKHAAELPLEACAYGAASGAASVKRRIEDTRRTEGNLNTN